MATQFIVYKKLVLNNEDGNYYYYDGTTWQSIGNTLTYAEFGDYGMEQIEYATLSYFTDYKIFDIWGKQIIKGNCPEKRTIVDDSSFSKGNYFVVASNINEPVHFCLE